MALTDGCFGPNVVPRADPPTVPPAGRPGAEADGVADLRPVDAFSLRPRWVGLNRSLRW